MTCVRMEKGDEMKVVEVTEFGGPEVLVPKDAPDPEAAAGEAVVAISAAHVLFVEVRLRSGWGREYWKLEPPYVPGGAVAGTVLSVGDGVDQGWLGRRIVARTGERGGYAERVAVPAENLVPVPDGVDPAAAAALVHDGPTALRLAENAAIGRDDRVLVVGAGGGLGLLLTQLAHAAGAYVVAAARGKRKLDLAVESGADQAVDYSEPDWPDRVRAATGGVGPDVVLDGVGGEIGGAAVALAADGARVSVHGAASGGFTGIDQDAVARRGLRVRGIEQVQFSAAEARPLIERALAAAAEGALRPVVGQAVPLERAADAHAAMEARSVLGSTVLVP